MTYKKEYQYSLESIINDRKRNILLVEQIRMPVGKSDKNKNFTKRGYRYKCLNCGNIDCIGEYNIDKGNGCSVCSNNKVVRGINDIATTQPHLIKYFVNIEDAYKYSYLSGKKVLMKCLNCNYEKETIISTLYSQGFSCKKCGDGISYPNKFIFNMLQQLLNTNFETEKIFRWAEDKRYDFYIPNIGIIEVHGMQHYQKSTKNSKFAHTLKEEQENDKLKEQLAKDNGIENYIIIDCRRSEMEWIKNSILNSKLTVLFNLNKINWLKCEEFACKSMINVVCNLWNNGIKSSLEIRKILKIARSTVILYLKRGAILNWVDYDSNKAKTNPRLNCRKENGSSARRVVCLNTNMIFDCIDYAIEYYKEIGINTTHIGECCRGKRKHCGKLPNGEKLEWVYYENFKLLQVE